ncbi:PREDICTED: uncharacterized protein LOC109582861 isoform X1 [Amphimedon queenslandica]|uniref:Uncharacterized protein n=1 Tax=Amphimedon queenslandica TaxID=400682 RepID=A0AAN0J9P1_AMPQE|nr:PREDICTED: uncharacterized protein LOC109582861 isoform X1 [Amphimedon queenslandica]|eukprot:XP_019853446.1 PREDICTED: uncharacterized protein LOC109582861 isoform X1 [Amphimedon queenslandica]
MTQSSSLEALTGSSGYGISIILRSPAVAILKAGVGSEKIDISYSSQVIEGVKVLRELKTASRGGGGGGSGSTGRDDSYPLVAIGFCPLEGGIKRRRGRLAAGIIKLWK